MDEQAYVVNRQVLMKAAAHLGVGPYDLEAVLVNRTKWVRRDLYSMLLDAQGASDQRDSLMRDLYAILVTFVEEMANKHLASPNDAPPALQIIQLDLPGYQSRTMTSEPGSGPSLLPIGPLINVSGQNGINEFLVNSMNEMVHLRRAFEDENAIRLDEVELPTIAPMDNAACIELLRGGLLGSSRLAKHPGGVMGLLEGASKRLKGDEWREAKAKKLLDQLTSSFGRHVAFIANPGIGLGPLPTERHMFAINHYSGQCAYDATNFVDHNADVLDKQLVDLLRTSSDSFIAKLVSGPGLATECHPLDENISVEGQVSVSPLRIPTTIIHPLIGSQPGKDLDWPVNCALPQPVSTQLNACLSNLLETLDRTRIWTVACIRPNDSGQPNSFDKRRVKAQVRSLLLPDLVNRRQVDYIANYGLVEFCTRHELRNQPTVEAVEAFAQSKGWLREIDYAIGLERIWMGWAAWREQEDSLKSTEARRDSAEALLR